VDYRDGNLQAKAMRMSDVTYYKIAEYQEEPEVTKDMDSSEIFLLAAHRELKAHQFYSELAALHPEGEARDMLRKMANEELKHKEKMEYLYTNTTFRQTSGG
jgi:rubrerythrin